MQKEKITEEMLSFKRSIDENIWSEYLTLLESEQLETGGERHHALPIAHFPQFIDDKWNIIRLSPRNHYMAHYLLAKMLNTKEMIFALNQMRRVAKKMGNGITEEEVSKYFEEFRVSLSKHLSEMNKGRFDRLPIERQEELRKIWSKHTSGTIVGRDVVTGERRRMLLTDKDFETGAAVYDSYGRKHSQETKDKMSESGNGDNKGYPYTNTETGIIKYFRDGEDVPSSYVSGMTYMKEMASERFTDLIFVHNKEGISIRVKESEIPEGYSRGRIDFGESGNYFASNVIVLDCITGEKKHIKKGEPTPPYHRNAAQKILFRYGDNISVKRPLYCHQQIPIENKEEIAAAFEKYNWVNELIVPKRKTGRNGKKWTGFICPEEA